MYAKLFGSILDSSLWTAEPSVRILFLTMLAMADREGRIFASKSGLCRRAVMKPEDFVRALEKLEGPDFESSDLMRNPENGGRRIEPAAGGWQIVNYKYYRGLRDEDERRDGDRKRQEKHRASRFVTKRHKKSRGSRFVTPSEAEAEAEAYADNTYTNTGDVGGEDAPPIPPSVVGVEDVKKLTKVKNPFKTPSVDEVRAFIEEKQYPVDALSFCAHYEANGWMVGKNRMKNWKAAVVTWVRRREEGAF